MADTYTQLLIQFVFAVKGRHNLIHEAFRDPLEKYMCGIVSGNRSKPLAIYCNPDHVHILVGMNPSLSCAELIKDIKTGSTAWIKKQNWPLRGFSWQEGYGAFSYSRSQLDVVVRYILNQPLHHRKKSFKEEYAEFLRKFEVEYNEKYLFEFYG
jgi:REP element-mobilizing transposase RayT